MTNENEIIEYSSTWEDFPKEEKPVIDVRPDALLEFEKEFPEKISWDDDRDLEYIVKNYKIERIFNRYPKFLQKEAIKIIKEALEVKKEIYGKSSLDNVMYEIFSKGLSKLRKEIKLHKIIINVIKENPEKDFGHIVNEVYKTINKNKASPEEINKMLSEIDEILKTQDRESK
jgi:hypothetical protein